MYKRLYSNTNVFWYFYRYTYGICTRGYIKNIYKLMFFGTFCKYGEYIQYTMILMFLAFSIQGCMYKTL